MATTTSTFDSLLAPGLRKIYDLTGEQRQKYYPMFCNMLSSSRAYEEDQTLAGLGLSKLKLEGTNTTYDDPVEGETKRYTHLAYGLGFRITHEMWEDDLYNQMNKFPQMLRWSNDELVETQVADMLNNGFEATASEDYHKTAQSNYIFSTTGHAQPGTTDTFINEVATDMSITALQTMTNYYESQTNPRGLQIQMRPQLILVPYQLRFTMREIFNTTKAKPFTSDNEVNSILDEDMSWAVNHYLTDSNSWFVFSNKKDQHWPNFFWREQPSFENGFDFDSGDAKFKTFFRFSFGVTDPQGLYGSRGAS